MIIGNAGYGLFGAAEELADEQIGHEAQTGLAASTDFPPGRVTGTGVASAIRGYAR